MADQKSRGGQKEGFEKQQGKKDRDVHPDEGNATEKGRDMKEDAARGKQGENGGYTEEKHQEQTS